MRTAYTPSSKIPTFPGLTPGQADMLLVALLVLGGGTALTSLLWLQTLTPASPVSTFATLLFWLSLSCFLLLSYAAVIEPHLLVINRKTLKSALPAGLRIAVAADMHVGPFKGKTFIERLVRRINALKPDLILLPGDFLFDETAPIDDLAPFKKLHAPLGVFAVAGNHDAGNYLSLLGKPYSKNDRTDELEAFLGALGIPLLRNACQILQHTSGNFVLAGIDDLWSPSCDLAGCLNKAKPDLPLLLLSHNPDVVLDERSLRADLIVSGHLHGGQMRLPFIGALKVPALLSPRYAQGLFRFGERTQLLVTRGAGETLVRARLFCWPEIVLLTTATEHKGNKENQGMKGM